MIMKTFRVTAILEGLSYLALFAFSMPLKYWAGIPEYNIYVGYAHGALFLLYVALAIVCFVEYQWSRARLAKILLAALLPFGAFYVEEHYLRPVETDQRQS